MMPYVYGYIGAAIGTVTAGAVATCVTTTRIRNRADDARYRVPLAPEREDLTEPMPRIAATHHSDETAAAKDYIGVHRMPLTIGDRAEIAGDRLRGLALRRQTRQEATTADERSVA